MAKPKKTTITQPSAPPVPPPLAAEKPVGQILPGFRIQAIILSFIGFALYCNTFTNSWAFDDMLVILQNSYVQEGFAGIPKILGGDAFESFTRNQNENSNQLTGGRYRPLSIVTFAVEEQLMGISTPPTDSAARVAYFKASQEELAIRMHARHVVNVLLFLASVVVLLYFLRKIVFPRDDLAAFITALIFTVHPIHTEVVANVKSRDEILSLLFMCLTFIKAFTYLDSKKMQDLLLAMVCYLMMLLSKEYGVAMIVLLPVSFYFFRNRNWGASVKHSLIYLAPLAVYLAMRFSAVTPANDATETDVMNNPYVLATPVEKIASEVATLIEYVRLLLWPHPLTADYSYRHFPFVDFSSLKFWLSGLVHAGLVVMAFVLYKRRHVAGFALLLYFAFLALVCNIFVNIGAPMGERLIYHSSVGFAIVAGWALSDLYFRLPAQVAKIALACILIVVTGLSAVKTMQRNKDWESNITLFLKDVQTVPNSVIANSNAGMASLELSRTGKDTTEQKKLIRQAIAYFDRTIELNPAFVLAYLNRGTSHLKLGEYELALNDCDTVVKYYPVHPQLPYLAVPLAAYYTTQGVQLSTAGNGAAALESFYKAMSAAPTDVNVVFNVGFTLVRNGQTDKGREYLRRVLQLSPGHSAATQVLQQIGK